MEHKSRRDDRRMACGIGPACRATSFCGAGTPQPSLRDSRAFGVQPSVETLGYSRLSFRDRKAAVFSYGVRSSLALCQHENSWPRMRRMCREFVPQYYSMRSVRGGAVMIARWIGVG